MPYLELSSLAWLGYAYIAYLLWWAFTLLKGKL